MSTTAPEARRHTFGHAMHAHFSLDPAITYLNHGTVGVVPKRVQQAQQAIRDEIERQPARFVVRELADVGEFVLRMPPRMRTAADAVAHFLGCDAKDLAFVDNATAGYNAVLQSWPFQPGDEILITDHCYGTVGYTADYVAKRTGAKVVTATLPFPETAPEKVVAAIEAALTPRTRMAVVDHVCAPSALVLPVAEIAARLRARGVVTLVDGAHALGALPVDLRSIGADFYTGNLHKWAMAPRPSAILWAAPAVQKHLHPTVISWGYEKGMSAEFDMLGTRDASVWLAAPEGIAFMRELGLDAMREYNHRTVWDAARSMTQHWGTKIPAPESMYGSMVTIPLPERFGTTREAGSRLKDALLFEENIEAQVFGFKTQVWARLAAQVYNDASDFEKLRLAIEKRAPGLA
jgi:isopenicillin-N epimerase